MTEIPEGMPQHASYWYRRWLVAQEGLDEEAAQRISLHATTENLRRALKEAAAEMDRRYVMGAAAERERIRQLAISNEAVCAADEGTCCYFADLIRPDP